MRGGKLDEADRDATLGRMRITTDFGELADRQLVVEAVVEDEELKTEVFGLLDKVVEADDAILASNTSSIPIMKLGHGDAAGPSTSSASTSSTRCRCCSWSSWSRRC